MVPEYKKQYLLDIFSFHCFEGIIYFPKSNALTTKID